MRPLQGLTRWITGAGSGIGEATALAYAAAGMTLVLSGRRPAELDRVAAACRAAGASTGAGVVRCEPLDIAELLATVDGVLDRFSLRWHDDAALTVVMAAQGYPGTPRKGSVIRGLEAAEATGARVFHAGTDLRGGELVANGGRVLAVTATAVTVAQAQAKAYAAIAKIDWPQGFCRSDIGWRAVERENA